MRRFDYSTNSLLLALTISYSSAHLFVVHMMHGEYVFAYLRGIFLFVFLALLVAKGVKFKEFCDKAIDLAKPKCSIQAIVALFLTAVVLRVFVFNILEETPLEFTAKNFIDQCIIPPVNEELFFRGIVLMTLLRNIKSTFFAIVISAAFFASCHNIDSLLYFAALSICGTLLGTTFYLSRSISMPIVIHFIWNAIVFINVSIVS